MLPFDLLLPLVEGWGYKRYSWSGETRRGEERVMVEERKYPGLLINMSFRTNDAYCGVKSVFSGPRAVVLFECTPQTLYEYTMIPEFPTASTYLYSRPDPSSTAGDYFIVLFTSGFEGILIPFSPPLMLWGFLSKESTQASATMDFYALAIVITDREAYLRGLREVLGLR